MASGQITADGAQAFQTIIGEAVHASVAGVFGGGTVALEQNVNGTVYPILDNGVAITFTAAADIRLNAVVGDEIRLNMSGSTTPVVDFNLAGASIAR